MSAVAFAPPLWAAPISTVAPLYPNMGNFSPVQNFEMAPARRFVPPQPLHIQLASPALPTGAYGVQNVGIQSYLPVNQKRSFTFAEKQSIQTGLGQWWPKIFKSYATPTAQLLANPAKSAILAGGILGLVGLAVGLSANVEHRGLAAGVIGTITGGIGAALGFFGRQQKNEDVLDLMSRFPEGATRRDILSDPVYQADLNRKATSDSTYILANNLSSSWPNRSSSSQSYASRRSTSIASTSRPSVSRGGGGRGGGH